MVKELIVAWLEWLSKFQQPETLPDEERGDETLSLSPMVIVDNAPGYSGLEPELEKWLLDLGPKVAKFIFLATPEPQDLKACKAGMDTLYSFFEKRIEVVEVYKGIKNYDSVLKPDDSTDTQDEKEKENKKALADYSEIFFKRLVESEPVELVKCRFPALPPSEHRGCKGSGLCYYRSEPSLDDGKRFIGLVVNKVAEKITGKVTVFSDEYRKKVSEYLSGNWKNTNWKSRYGGTWEWIPFDMRFVSINYLDVEKGHKPLQEFSAHIKDLIMRAERLSHKIVGSDSGDIVIRHNIETLLTANNLVEEIFEETKLRANNYVMTDFWSDVFYPLAPLMPIIEFIKEQQGIDVSGSQSFGRFNSSELNQVMFSGDQLATMAEEIFCDIDSKGWRIKKDSRTEEINIIYELISVFAVPILLACILIDQQRAETVGCEKSLDLVSYAGSLILFLVEFEYALVRLRLFSENFLNNRNTSDYWHNHLKLLNSSYERSLAAMKDIEKWSQLLSAIGITQTSGTGYDITDLRLHDLFKHCCAFYAATGFDTEIGQRMARLMNTMALIQYADIVDSGMLQDLRKAIGDPDRKGDDAKQLLQQIVAGEAELRFFKGTVENMYLKLFSSPDTKEGGDDV